MPPRPSERVRCVRRRDAPAPHGAGPTPPLVGIAGQHDALADRRARLLAIGWDATSLVVPVCARLGADPAALLRGGRRLAECRARAVIVYVVCDGAALSVTAAARLLGVSDTAVGAARRRGRDLLAELGWTIEDVLSWSGFQA